MSLENFGIYKGLTVHKLQSGRSIFIQDFNGQEPPSDLGNDGDFARDITNLITYEKNNDIYWQQQPFNKNVYDIIGDNTTTQFTINHNLNSRNFLVQVVEDFGTNALVWVTSEKTTLNELDIYFLLPPAIGENYKVILI